LGTNGFDGEQILLPDSSSKWIIYGNLYKHRALHLKQRWHRRFVVLHKNNTLYVTRKMVNVNEGNNKIETLQFTGWIGCSWLQIISSAFGTIAR
jgi:hypothetical protein